MDLRWMLTLLVVMAFIGVLWWAIGQLSQYLPGPLATIIRVFVVLFFCIWLLDSLGGLGFGGAHGHLLGYN